MYGDDEHFNCYQRAHQNYLEHIPHFLVLLLLSSLYMPKYAAALGALWLVGRTVYALGYYTGNPKNRLYGFGVSILAHSYESRYLVFIS